MLACLVGFGFGFFWKSNNLPINQVWQLILGLSCRVWVDFKTEMQQPTNQLGLAADCGPPF